MLSGCSAARLEQGSGQVELPLGLARKYPSAGREWGWQWALPATRIYMDRATGERRRHHLHESVLPRTGSWRPLNLNSRGGFLLGPSADAAELTDLKVAVLVTLGTPITTVAKREAGATPIVSVLNDPVGSGFVQSLARPGGTITGLSLTPDAGFSGKWLELVKETVPRASRVGVIWNSTNRSNAAAQKEIGPWLR